MVGLGGNCAAGAELCGPGYVCDLGTSQCVSFPKLGESCGPSKPICIGGYCDLAVTGTCTAYKQVGDACTPLDFFACEPGSTCDLATSRCKADEPTTCQAP
jgi:hypothetical protein